MESLHFPPPQGRSNLWNSVLSRAVEMTELERTVWYVNNDIDPTIASAETWSAYYLLRKKED